MGSTGWVISPFWECPFQKQGGILAELCIARRYWCVCSVSRHSSYSYTLNYHKYTQGKSNKTTLFLYNFSKLFVASRLATVLYHWEWVCWTFSCFYGVLLCTKSSLTNDIGTIFQLRLLWISLFVIFVNKRRWKFLQILYQIPVQWRWMMTTDVSSVWWYCGVF